MKNIEIKARGSYTVINGKIREVKNLGWLLKNWKAVKNFEISPGKPGTCDAYLRANLSNGYYTTDFACYSVLTQWLKRPVFYGVTVYDYKAVKEYQITK